MGVVVRRYIDIFIIIITFLYSTCISSVFGSSIPTYLFIFSPFFKKEECQIVCLFFLRCTHVNGAIIVMLYTHSIGN